MPTTRRLRAVVAAVLVAAVAVVARPEPAVAFASTGTVTVDAYYSYSYEQYSYPYTPARYINVYISAYLCADAWAGTSTSQSGAGAGCYLQLAGRNVDSYPQVGLKFDGWYTLSGSSYGYALRLDATPVSFNLGPATATGTASYNGTQYEGPATATYNLTPISSSSCSPNCSTGYYWSSGYGDAMLTIDYALH